MHSGDRTCPARSFVRAAIAAAAVAITLTACTGSAPTSPPEPVSESPTAAPSSPSPTPTPTVDLTVPPVPPEAMSTPSAEGAAAAATHFTQLYAHAYATGDLTAWKAMSEPDCQFCNNVISGVDAMIAEGESDTSAPIVVTYAYGTEIIPDASYSATLRMHQGASERLDGTGNVLRSAPGGDFELYFAIAWRDGWVVREIDTKVLGQTPAPAP